MPTPTQFRTVFPDFAAITDDIVQFYLTRGGRDVDDSWFVEDREYGVMLRAADLMTQRGIGATEAGEALSNGLAAVRSGSLSLTFSDRATADAANGVNQYGREWELLVCKNRGGPRVVVTGGCGPFGGYRDGPLA